MAERARRVPAPTELLFNVVITPGSFRYLNWFTRSLIEHSSARFRLVANGCGHDELRSMRDFADADPGRVLVFDLAASEMLPHGRALDETYDAHDDGELFCFVDSDVKAKRPFMAAFLELLPSYDAVTSCNVSWTDDTVLPPDARRLAGRHALGSDGFVYGTSYFAIYARKVLQRVRTRWGVTFRAGAHEQLPPAVRHRLESMHRQFDLYDTAKVVNILLQGDGFALAHVENDALVHFGGISQFLSDPDAGGLVRQGAGSQRLDFARWAAATLRSLVDGDDVPALIGEGDDRSRAGFVQHELIELARARGVR